MSISLASLKTPGVYVDEMSLFPPSVAQVDTAIPVFIGPTEKASSPNTPVRISSMAEYRDLYGGGPERSMTVELDARNNVTNVSATSKFYLHDSVLMYFSNGGEKCYIVSTGTYDYLKEAANQTTLDQYDAIFDTLTRFDEPTLVVMPDAMAVRKNDGTFDDSKAYSIQQKMVNHCEKMQDRFAILDVPASVGTKPEKSAEDFRLGVSGVNQSYAAAYYPFLKTTLPLSVSYAGLSLVKNTVSTTLSAQLPTGSPAQGVVTTLDKLKQDTTLFNSKVFNPLGVNATLANYNSASNKQDFVKSVLHAFFQPAGDSVPVAYIAFNDDTMDVIYYDYIGIKKSDGTATNSSNGQVYTALHTSAHGTTLTAKDIDALFVRVQVYLEGFASSLRARIKTQETELMRLSPLYAGIVSSVASYGIVLPPSGAVAGAIARTDSTRGVWKSPANVGLNYVSGPLVAITDDQQQGLNVDVTAGKSINAIRAFSGKGTLVWGARTLDGSSNEWRYVSVRRFFLMAEESIKKATAQFVFESNDANTWVRIRAMIENFLTLQWRAGALAGAKAEQAFFVRVGLGQTMTPTDVLEGRMIIEIGMAAVRPAEFIVLRFSHKMQEA